MSRIGKLPVVIPDKVSVAVDNCTVTVEGPKGKCKKTFDPAVSVSIEDNQVLVQPTLDTTFAHALQGTARSIIHNMVQGVVSVYSKDLELKGVGFRAALNGNVLDLALGFSHPIAYPIPESITVTVIENTKIKVEGVDKELVGQVAADIKHFNPVEPYKGKGVRILGQFVRRKEGKKTA